MSIYVTLPIKLKNEKIKSLLDYNPIVPSIPSSICKITEDESKYEELVLCPEPYNNNETVFKKETNEELFKEKSNYNLKLNDKNINVKLYDFLITHNTFSDICRIKSNCWHCCYKFDNNPIFIPTTFKDGEFNVYGCFCNFSCALSYNKHNSKTLDIAERESLIYLFYKKINNIKFTEIVNINYAPPKEVFKKFGGLIDINDYRDNKKLYNINYPPLSVIIPELQEIKVVPNKIITGNGLVLKRTKRVEKNTLDRFLN